MGVVGAAGDIFRWAAGAVVPMFARPVAPVGLAVFLHVVLVVGFTVGLYFVELHTGLTNAIGRGPGWFRPYWLPALFLLAYALTWSAVWLWRLLAPNQPTTDFPDIDDAWAEIVAALDKAGIGLADTPVFLVFGSHPGGFDPLFRALPGGLAVAGVPGAAAPIVAFANRDAIYLSVPGASLLGAQEQVDALAFNPSGGDGFDADGAAAMGQSVGFGQSIAMGQSVGFGQSMGLGASIGLEGSLDVGNPLGGAGKRMRDIQQIVARLNAEGRPPTEDERRRIQDLFGNGGGGGGGAAPAAGGRQAQQSVLQNPELVGDAEARLTHVCGLLAAARWPLCPANGAVLAIPATAAERTDAAQQWGLVARQDLAVAEAALRLRFPVYALLGGVEDLQGATAFFDRFAADMGKERLGKGFPLNPDVPPAGVTAAVESSAEWIMGSLLPYLVIRQMRVDGGAGGATTTRDNDQLVRFLAALRKRRSNLARLISRAVQPGPDRVPLYGGCYLSVVLRSDPTEARFARAFFQKVTQTQGYVAWTDEAYAAEAGYRNRTAIGYTFVAVWLSAVAAFGAYVAYAKWLR